ncbi:MAG: hypothetical protein MUP55_00705, partial [Candidatus Aenigmarchaeota archaeon]|nr:hypothetical protein [Candidatus Aenigmarchaeota archaeon]
MKMGYKLLLILLSAFSLSASLASSQISDCSQGEISSSCLCGGEEKNTGYCCHNVWFDPYYSEVSGGCPQGSYYYVDSGHAQASDSNLGTESLPWLTIQKAGAAMQAGDVTIVKSGDYGAGGTGSRYTPAIRPANSGTAGNPIVFKALEGVVVGVVPSEYGAVQAASPRTVTLGTNASSLDDYYDGWIIRIVSGTGAGQYRTILYDFSNLSAISYYGSTKLAYVQYDWDITPDSTSTYSL